MPRKRVLIVGLFLNKKNNIPTQALELSDILKNNGYDVLTVSGYKNRIIRLLHTIYFLLVKRRDFDVGIVQVYSGLSIVWELVSAFLIKRMKKKLILTIHGGGVPEKIRRNPRINMFLLGQADVITCPSPFMIHAMKNYNFDLTLIENLINMQDYDFFPKKNVQPVIFWMRALSPIYNPAMAVRAINELKHMYNYQNVKLYISGPDLGQRAYIEAMVKEYKLQENIEVTGFVNMQKKLLLAKECDIYICTNKIDNAPVSFLEMMEMGLPIVTTNIGGIPYLVTDNETALLVGDDDHKEMAKKIDYLITNSDVAKKLVANGREFVGKFSGEKVFQKWDKLLQEL